MAKNKSQEYNDDSIQVYQYPENIQKKPSMYIGDKNIEGCTHMVREVVDNSIDEALNSFGDKIIIKISNKKGTCLVEDYGRGIPPKSIETAFCTLHASGKFNNNEYSASAGTNGVGTTAVNALSKSFIVESVRDNSAYVQKFSNGLPITKLQKTGTKKKKSGTIVYFEPNKKFMGDVGFDFETIHNELSTKTYVLKGIKIILEDLDNDKKYEMISPNGLMDYIKKYNREPITDKNIEIHKDIEFEYDTGYEDVEIKNMKFHLDLMMSYSKKSSTNIISFCNSLLMREGGIQETTFKQSVTRFMKNYIQTNNLLPKKDEALFDKINGDNTMDGVTCIISIRHPDPIFENQTKNKLKSKEISSISNYITEALDTFAAENPKEMKAICNKIIVSVRASEAAKKARETVQKKGENQFSIVSDLSKLANCISKDIDENEIFITEGTSASGTAKEARDKRTQAVYSLRGKMLNTISLDSNKVLSNKECADLAYIITKEKNGIDENFDISKLQYGKIIFLCDADFDGYNIAILGITYTYKHMPGLIEDGRVFVAIPPLYSIIEKGKKRYFVDQEEYDNYIYKKILTENTFSLNNKTIKTIKGISKIFKSLDSLNEMMDNISNTTTGITKNLLLNLFHYLSKEKFTKSNIKAFLDLYEDIKENNGSYEGFFMDEYIYFDLTDIINIITKLYSFSKKNEIPINIVSNEESFTIKNYVELIEKYTPKSRTRLKGLGEMDADELRETTLDKEKRNMYKVSIKDAQLAEKSMNNFMNGNSKFVEFRKNILLKKQSEK